MGFLNFFKCLYSKKATENVVIPESKPQVKYMISYEDYITASNSYPDRLKSSELTDELKNNANSLLSKINKLLNDLHLTNNKVTSGFRPSEVNAGIGNAAKKSLHMTCNAIDLMDDKNQTIAKLIESKEKSNPGFLKSYGLWLETPDATKGKYTNWCHLDQSTIRSDRPIRIFIP